MKKTLIKISCVVVMFSLMLSSCSKDFQEINTDPNNIPNALPQQLLAPALMGSLTYNMLRNRNFNNELMQVSVNISDAEGQVSRYDFRSNWADYLYNGLYLELTNFKDIYKVASDTSSGNFNRSYMGISLICQSWLYSILTDTYGDIPYFQSNKGKDSLIFEPRFDSQKEIYLDIFKKLEEANELLSVGTAITNSSDPIYGGNISRWRKFGNSLYLRLLMRVSGKAEVSSQVIAKIKEIVDDNKAMYPVFSNVDESAVLKWTGAAPYTSPLISVREQDYRGTGIGEFFINNLKTWADPRIDVNYGANNINRWGIALYQGDYVGMPSGYAPGSNPVRGSYFYSQTSTTSLQTDPMTGIMMNHAELQFILAEAAAKGWISGSAENYYNAGALSSIVYWLPNWPNTINAVTGVLNNINTQLAVGDIEWQESASLEEKMELIHLQKYYALFMVDMQQWFEYRRTGHPNLPIGAGVRNNGVMPARMTYPVYVQSTNPTNYKLAIAAQGPDAISTQVWWQKP